MLHNFFEDYQITRNTQYTNTLPKIGFGTTGLTLTLPVVELLKVKQNL